MEMGLPCVILRSGSDTVRAAEWTGCEEGRDSSHAMLLWDDYPTRSSSLNATAPSLAAAQQEKPEGAVFDGPTHPETYLDLLRRNRSEDRRHKISTMTL